MYSEDQLRDFAMRVSWEMLDEDSKQQMLMMARASLQVADTLGVAWNMPDPNNTTEEPKNEK